MLRTIQIQTLLAFIIIAFSTGACGKGTNQSVGDIGSISGAGGVFVSSDDMSMGGIQPIPGYDSPQVPSRPRPVENLTMYGEVIH